MNKQTAIKIITGVTLTIPYIYGIWLVVWAYGADLSTDFIFASKVSILDNLITLLSFIILSFLIMHLYKNTQIIKNSKILWFWLLLIGNYFVFPFYWYKYIWKGSQNNCDASYE